MQKPILILLVLAFSVITHAQTESARRALEKKLDALRIASGQKQDAGPSADLQTDVKAFLKSQEVEQKNYRSTAFDTNVQELRRQANDIADAIGREGPLVTAVKDLAEENIAFRKTIEAAPASTSTPPLSPTGPPTDEDEGLIVSVSPYILPLLQGLAILSAVALLLYSVIAVQGMRRATDRYFSGVLPQSLSSLKKWYEDLNRQVEALGTVNRGTNQRLAEVHTEIRLMSRMIQQSALANNRTPNSPLPYVESTGEDELPSFPVSSEELLRRMERKALIVRRDFQNDMLVADPEGKGELVLLRDPEMREELQRLFIVPSVTQLQMRQEYHNFYEKYFDCANPESGSIWIVDPAVVEKVVGGWELREKGRLEFR